MSLIIRIVFIAVAMICDKVLMIDGVQSSKLGDFYRIGKKGTDKITHHGYHRFYPQYIEKYREFTEDYGMIEIGIQDSNSLRTCWNIFHVHSFTELTLNYPRRANDMKFSP